MDILTYLNFIGFGVENGDWSSALVSIFFGVVQTTMTLGLGIFGYFKWRKEVSAQRKEQVRANEEQARATEVEREENFIQNIKWYFSLMAELEAYGLRVLHSNYRDSDEFKKALNGVAGIDSVKSLAFRVINVLEVLYSFSANNNSRYKGRWEKHFSFVFRHKLFITCFNKHENSFAENQEFIDYVNKIIKNRNNDKEVEVGQVVLNKAEVFRRKDK